MEHFASLLLLAATTTACAQAPSPFGAPSRTTHWELSAALATAYNGQLMSSGQAETETATEVVVTPWSLAAGRRISDRWVLQAAFERMVTRHGQGVNDEYLGTHTYNYFFFSTTVADYRTDMLTTEHGFTTASVGGSYLLRPYRQRRTIGMSFRLAADLRVHSVSAEQGVAADVRTSESWDDIWGISYDGGRDLGEIALGHWDQRQVVNEAHATGLSIALGFRGDLHCTRYFSLFSTFSLNLPFIDPRFAAYTVPDTDITFPAYRIDLMSARMDFGAAVFF